ncbi:hypothetical protein D9M72_597000 [compost metagenome]
MRDERRQHGHPGIGQRAAQDRPQHVVQLAVDAAVGEHVRLSADGHGQHRLRLEFFDREGLHCRVERLRLIVGEYDQYIHGGTSFYLRRPAARRACSASMRWWFSSDPM